MSSAMKSRTDGPLLVEIVLVVILAAGLTVLYWNPVAYEQLNPRWWHWVILGVMFFVVAALHTWRMRHRSHRALHDAIRRGQAEPGEDVEEEEDGPREGMHQAG